MLEFSKRGVVMASKKKVLKQVDNDGWIYTLLLTTLSILIQSLRNYKVVLFGHVIGYGVFLIPVVFFLANYIVKEYDYKKGIAAIAISSVISVSFVAIIYFALGRNLILTKVCGDFLAYTVSQFVNLFIYQFLLSNKSTSYLLRFLTYMFSVIVYIMVYTLVYLDSLIIDGYWVTYGITLGIEFIICLPLAYFDLKIKKE